MYNNINYLIKIVLCAFQYFKAALKTSNGQWHQSQSGLKSPLLNVELKTQSLAPSRLFLQ